MAYNALSGTMVIREAEFLRSTACGENGPYRTENWKCVFDSFNGELVVRYDPDDACFSIQNQDLLLSLDAVSEKFIKPFVLNLPSVKESKHQAHLREVERGETEYRSWSANA